MLQQSDKLDLDVRFGCHLSGQVRVGAGQRCELYLRRGDAAAALARAVDGGGRLLDDLRDRSWGERAGYPARP